jgi:branched-chain amino acid transport system permease protein
MMQRLVYGVPVLAALAAFPFAAAEYPVLLAIEVIIFAIYAVGINLLLGYTGLVSLGHAMFLGLGGYGFGIFAVLMGWPVLPAMAATLLVIALIASAIGYVCTRTSGIEFLLITLAVSQMFYGLAVKTRATGGDDGLPGLPRPDLTWLGIDTSGVTGFYFCVLGVALIVLWLVWRLLNSPFGSVLVGIRESEKRMVALGYNVIWYKILAFTFSGMISSTAGLLLSQKLYFVNPDIMTWMISGEGLLMVIIGGRQYFLGPVLGAAFFIILKEQLSAITQDYIIIFGLFFMAVVALFRTGLAGFFIGLTHRRRAGVASQSETRVIADGADGARASGRSAE